MKKLLEIAYEKKILKEKNKLIEKLIEKNKQEEKTIETLKNEIAKLLINISQKRN